MTITGQPITIHRVDERITTATTPEPGASVVPTRVEPRAHSAMPLPPWLRDRSITVAEARVARATTSVFRSRLPAIVALSILALPLGGAPMAAAHDDCGRIERRADQKLRRAAKACYGKSIRAARRGESLDVDACQEAARAQHAARLTDAGCTVDRHAPEQFGPGSGDVRTALYPIEGKAVEVTYEVIDGMAVLEGDIVLGTADEVADVDRRLRAGDPVASVLPPPSPDGAPGEQSRLQTRSGTIRSGSFGWQNLIVPYQPYLNDQNLSQGTRGFITAAINHWNNNTIVTLVERTTEDDFLVFVNGDGTRCASPVGRRGGGQNVTVGACASAGSLIHEIGHAIGLYHEQSRLDRDDHVLYWPSNAQPDRRSNFTKYTSSTGVDRGRFDFGSIMLYSSFAFSLIDPRTGGLVGPTLTRRDGSTWVANRAFLSTKDINGVTLLATNRDGRSVFRLRNRLTGQCIEPNNPNASEFMRMAPCSSASNQKWYTHILPNGQNAGRQIVIHADTGLCVQMTGIAGASPRLYPCKQLGAQALRVVNEWGVAYTFTGQDGKRLTAGTNALIEQGPSSSGAQRWNVHW